MRRSPDERAVRAELGRILASPEFAHAEKLSRFLRYVVEETLAGRPAELKEPVIGVEVFGKPASYDPRVDSTVRGEATKLRARLEAFYLKRGSGSEVVISVPRGGYVADFAASLRNGRAGVTARPVLAWAVMSAALLLAGGLAAFALLPHEAPERFSFRQLTADGGLAITPTLSHDGSMVAYASDRGEAGNLDIWVQTGSGQSRIRLTRDPADDYEPAISPDGSRIAFRSERNGGGVHVVPALGGEPKLLAPHGRRPRFSPDGRWIAYYTANHVGTAGGIHVVEVTGENGRQLEVGVRWAVLPAWSPDGRSLLFLGSNEPSGNGRAHDWDWWVAPLEGGAAVPLGVHSLLEAQGLRGFGRDWYVTAPALSTGMFGGVVFPAEWVGDRILFSAQQGGTANLWAFRSAADGNRILSGPERLTSGSGREIHFDASSRSGPQRIAFSSVVLNADIWRLPVNHRPALAHGDPGRFTRSGSDDFRPSASVDGGKVVFLSNRAGNVDVWLKDLKSGTESAITSTPWDETHALLSPDGSRVAFVEQKPEGAVLRMAATSGATSDTVCRDCGMPLGWSPDGRALLVWWGAPIRFGRLDIATGRRSEILRHPEHDILRAQYSPDGKWLAFVTGGDLEGSAVFIAPGDEERPAGESDWIAVTDGSEQDCFPFWSHSGGDLYFLSSRDGFLCLWTIALDPESKRPRGGPSPLYHFHGPDRPAGAQFGGAVTPDGLLFTLVSMTSDIWLMESAQ